MSHNIILTLTTNVGPSEEVWGAGVYSHTRTHTHIHVHTDNVLDIYQQAQSRQSDLRSSWQFLVKPSHGFRLVLSGIAASLSASFYTTRICCLGLIPASGMFLVGAKLNNYVSLSTEGICSCLSALTSETLMCIYNSGKYDYNRRREFSRSDNAGLCRLKKWPFGEMVKWRDVAICGGRFSRKSRAGGFRNRTT